MTTVMATRETVSATKIVRVMDKHAIGNVRNCEGKCANCEDKHDNVTKLSVQSKIVWQEWNCEVNMTTVQGMTAKATETVM